MANDRDKLVEELRGFYRDRKVFMTGGQGFKGAILIALLEELGADVVNVGLQREDNLLFPMLRNDLRATSYELDVRDHDAVVQHMVEASPDVVFHLAAQPIVSVGYADPYLTFSSNTIGTVNVLDAIRTLPGKVSAVIVTTDKAYFNAEKVEGYTEEDLLLGHDPYSASKSAAEHAIYSFKKSYFDATVGTDNEKLVSPCRAGNVIGGGDFSVDRLVPDLAKAMKAGVGVPIRNFDATRPYEHVLDAVFAYVILAAKQWDNTDLVGAYNIGPNDESIMTNREVVTHFANGGTEIIDASGGGTFHETTLLKLNSGKFRDALNWEPYWASKEDILTHTFDWYKRWADGDDMSAFTRAQVKEFLND